MFTLKNGSIAACLFACLAFTSCQKEEIDPQNQPAATFNAAPVLANVATNVITATYADLDQQAARLQAAVRALAAAPTPAALAAARQAYRDTRQPWETTEAFAFGPVSTQGLDGVIDTWPLDVTGLDALLASSDSLTANSLRQKSGVLQGFHPIEYLLFGTAANKALADFTPREYLYLTASAVNLKRATGQLLAAWQPTGGNFAARLATAGPGNTFYPSQRRAVQELLDGVVGAATELPDSKIEGPLAAQNTDLEEAKYSQNSKAEFLGNLSGIENIYFGRYGQAAPAGPGLQTLVQAKAPALDARFRQELADAQAAVAAIPGRFDEAIFRNPAAVRAAQAKIRVVQATLTGDVQAVVKGL